MRAAPAGPATLRARLAEAEAALRAIRRGEVDAVVVPGPRGPRVFTLEGTERAYRTLIESMNEGAVTLAGGNVIVYANRCFARMAGCPLRQVIGAPLSRFLSGPDSATLRALLNRAERSGAAMTATLAAGDGSSMPVRISIRSLPTDGLGRAVTAVVVTDMSEARRAEDLMRALANRTVEAREAERARVSIELHDGITQHLCAVLFRCQALADRLTAVAGPSGREAANLRRMLGAIAEEVERISRNLRPSVLDQLGLVAVVHDTGAEFANRTGLPVGMAGVTLAGRLSAEAELTLYRVLQEALGNVERHSRARRVTVCLRRQGAFAQLTVRDNGIGFAPGRLMAARKDGSLGLLGIEERVAFAGGSLKVRSPRHAGTEVVARIPLLAPGRPVSRPSAARRSR